MSLVIVGFLVGGVALGLCAYLHFPASEFFASPDQGGEGNPNLWYYGVIVGMAGGAALFAGAILTFVYNCLDGWDWGRFICMSLAWGGAACLGAACVLLGLTTSTFVDGVRRGTFSSDGCYNGYCNLGYITGAACGVSGLAFIFGFCLGITALLTT